jgi:hypothetical protein
MTTNSHISKVNTFYRSQYPKDQPVDVPCVQTSPRRVEVVNPLTRKARSTGVEICLQTKSLLLLTGDHSGEKLSVLAGGVWVTQSGNSEDILLDEDGSFDITRKGTILVEGMLDSRLKINGLQDPRKNGRGLRGAVEAIFSRSPGFPV